MDVHDSPPEATDPAPKRRGTELVILLVIVAVVAAVVSGFWIGRSPKGPAYPTSWDPRVADLVSYVENHRGLTFKHPVYVDFLTDAEFTKEVTSDGSDLTEKDKKDQANGEALMRALGMISGKTDLFKESNALQGAGVIGLYSFGDQKIRVRGDQLTPSVRVTLVHEMTHALQDQYFDLTATYARLDKNKTQDSSAFHAIVEGDATRIQNDYQESLSKADKAAISAQDAKDGARFKKGASSVPEIMQALFGAPYPLGEFAVQVAFGKGGNQGVDSLFTNPPGSDLSIMDPTLIDAPEKPATIPELTLAADEKEVDRGTFGGLPLFLMLAKAEKPWVAVFIADSDINDRYVQYTKAGTSCVRAEFLGRDAAAADVLKGALAKWAAGTHTGATVAVAGKLVTINSCDPGPAYVATADHSNEALNVLVTRNAIYAGVRGDGAPSGYAMCFADKVIEHYAAANLTQLNATGPSKADQATLKGLAGDCAKS